jgi:predicted nucleotidyltransferase
MKITGIIAEYDPFHNGHLYHMKKAREMTDADAVITVMSGHFMQRGTPSFFERDQRVKMAVDSGSDLVIELPYIYACNSSHEFARGSIGILNGLGCVDNIVFGAETDDTDMLVKAAEAVLDRDERLTPFIKESLDRGISYPESLTGAVRQVYGTEISSVLRSPNNLLGIEYIRAIMESGSAVKPAAVARNTAPHGEDISESAERNETDIVSATTIRNLVCKKGISSAAPFVPAETMNVLRASYSHKHTRMKDMLFELLRYRIITSSESELAEIYGVDEGIENRLKSVIFNADSTDSLAELVISRRYTRARINRMFIHILMNLKEKDFLRLRGTYYARILGFSDIGQTILRTVSKTADIPVLSNLSRLELRDETTVSCIRYDMRASDTYSLLCGSLVGQEKKYVPYRRN